MCCIVILTVIAIPLLAPGLVDAGTNCNEEVDFQIKDLQEQLSQTQADLQAFKEKYSIPCQSENERFDDWPDPKSDNSRNVLTRTITFSAPFSELPAVSAGLSRIDSEEDRNLRIKRLIDNVTLQSFELTCDSWYNTKLYAVSVSWFAC